VTQLRQDLIDGLARPGGNITGVSDVATTLTTKRLSLLKELSPTMRRVAMLWNKDDLGMTLRYEASAKVAQAVGVIVQPLAFESRMILMKLLLL
jgi:putative tryptophan/tyrosine transport system substrate-binding protein